MFIELGTRECEVAVYLDGRVQEVYRTDAPDLRPVITRWAKDRVEALSKVNPGRNYTFGDVPKHLVDTGTSRIRLF